MHIILKHNHSHRNTKEKGIHSAHQLPASSCRQRLECVARYEQRIPSADLASNLVSHPGRTGCYSASEKWVPRDSRMSGRSSSDEWYCDTYDNSVCCGCANPSSDRFESLLDIYDKTPLNGRHVNPFSILVEYLESSCVVLGQKGEKTRGVLVRANTLGVLRCRWVFDKF